MRKTKKMFKKTVTEKQANIFSNISTLLNGTASKYYQDTHTWHNMFRADVFSNIDEGIYKILFDEKMGAPNSSIRTLLSMMILKEGFGWSDSELFENCNYNLLVRGALGLVNIDDKIPAESTYYLFRKRIHEHSKIEGDSLIEKTFQSITKQQAIEYNVNGKSIRMDSKLLGSNIAWCTRYELIHQTISFFLSFLDSNTLSILSDTEKKLAEAICKEKGEKVVYRSNRTEIQKQLTELGLLMYKLINIFSSEKGEPYDILQRVFHEQYKIEADNEIILRPKEELKADNAQSPYDTDCTYRKKDDQEVKGYSDNITETCDDNSLKLIVDIQVEPASTPDTEFVIPGIQNSTEVLDEKPENVITDGAYHSPANAAECKEEGINFYTTGMQGQAGKYDLDMTKDGLIITDRATGEIIPCQQTKTGTWKIDTNSGYRYFTKEQIDSCTLRRQIEQLPIEIKNKRNNVESGIFQLCYHTRNNKVRYRGIIKHKMWASMRCLWINFRRIVKWVEKLCEKNPNCPQTLLFLYALRVFAIGILHYSSLNFEKSRKFYFSPKYCII